MEQCLRARSSQSDMSTAADRRHPPLSRRAACGSAVAPAAPTAAPKPAAAQSTGATSAPAPAAPAVSTVGLSAPTKTTQQPKLGGTLRVGMVGDITSLDPFVWSPNNSNTVGQVHDQLITYDDKL